MNKGLQHFQNLKANTLVVELIKYIEDTLPDFRQSEQFIEILAVKKNENQHSAAFCNYMTTSCQSQFYFLRENAQKGSSTVDIGVYKGANLFFTIEAKILPIPLDKERKEYEYVYGNGAGIQRFKDEKHGLGNRDELLGDNGLIAYIKEENFTYWHNRVNQWISDAKWPKEEKLHKLSEEVIAKLKSTHKRINGTEVRLHHFWIYVDS